MKLSVLVLGPGSAVHVIHPSAYCRDHQRTRPDGSPSSADSGRIDERETYRLASNSSSRGEMCWASAHDLRLRRKHKSIPEMHLGFRAQPRKPFVQVGKIRRSISFPSRFGPSSSSLPHRDVVRIGHSGISDVHIDASRDAHRALSAALRCTLEIRNFRLRDFTS